MLHRRSSGPARLARVVLCACAAFATFAPSSACAEALLLRNGHILTAVDAPRSKRWADALLTVDGRVTAVGREADVRRAAKKLASAPAERDLHGAFAMPGLIDAHGHIGGLGLSLRRLRFFGTTSAEQIAGMVAETAAKRPNGEWIFGRGWDQNDWTVKSFPTHALLDAAAPEHPVWLRRVDGHAGWANARAMAIAGVTRETRDPDGGRIERDGNGEPTGVFVDNAMGLVNAAIPALTPEQTKADLASALRECARFGLTGVHDAGIDMDALRAYRELEASGTMAIRIAAMLSSGAVLHDDALSAPRAPGADGAFRIFAVKAYADGALGSRGAALLEPYADDPGNRGLLVTSPDTLELLARRSLAAGLPLCIHAIGDRGNRVALEACERAAGSPAALRGKRFRIEHAQVVALDDIARMGRAGFIASMQPTHCTSDMPWAPDRVGAARIEGAYAWRRMLTAGVRLAFGSDFPVEPVDPLLGIHAAVTTQDEHDQPPAGYRPSEKLGIWETLSAFTVDAAYAASMEREVGRLLPGYRADVVIFDRDLTSIPFATILQAHCTLTIMNGQIVWDAAR
jgi:predicted amidohydrolase YtcJ